MKAYMEYGIISHRKRRRSGIKRNSDNRGIEDGENINENEENENHHGNRRGGEKRNQSAKKKRK